MNTRTLLRAVGLTVLLSGVAIAQENLPTPTQAGAYDLFGTLKAGYRMTSINSSDESNEWLQNNARNIFREQFNLLPSDSGFSLGRQLPLSFSLFGTKREGQDGFFDQLFLNADFNPTVAGGSLRMRKFNAFDFNASYKHVDYFFDRYDSLYSDLRTYNQNRNDIRASLDIDASEMLGVSLEYHGVGHGGYVDFVRPMFLEGAPEGSQVHPAVLDRYLFNVARNYYMMDLPRTDFNSEFSGALNLGLDMLSAKVGGGYSSFSEDFALSPVMGDSLPLNFKSADSARGYANSYGVVGDNNIPEKLHSYSQTEERRLSGPFVFGQLVIKPIDMLRLVADVRLDMLEGTTKASSKQIAEIRRTFAADTARKLPKRVYNILYNGQFTNDITNTLDRTNMSFVATLAPIPEMSVAAGIKYSVHDFESTAKYHLTVDTAKIGTSDYHSFLGDGENTKQYVDIDWENIANVPTQTYFGSVNYSPMKELTLSAGVTASTRKPDVVRKEDGVPDSVVTNNMSKEVSSLGFDIGATFRPMKELRLRARFENQTREAKFGEDEANGPAAGTLTDLEPRITPEKKMRFSAAADWEIVSGLSAGVRFGMQKASSDLNESMWVADSVEKAELKDDNVNVSGVIAYNVDENTVIRLAGESRSSDFAIPVTWTRGTGTPTPEFGTEAGVPPTGAPSYTAGTAVIRQKTDDIFLDFNVSTKLIDALTIGAGVQYLTVTGEPTVSAAVTAETGTPIKTLGDVTRTGGPFDRTVITGNLGYDITKQFGVVVDVMYAMQEEKELKDDPADPNAARWFYGFNDYKGLAAAFSVVYNF